MTLDENLTYTGSFSEAANDTFVLSGGNLLLNGADTFSGGTVDGSKLLETEGTTTVSGLTIGGTAEWENTKTVTQSGGTVTIGDASGDKAFLDNTAKATYDIAGAGAIARGSSTTSYIDERRPHREDGRDGHERDHAVRDQHRNARSCRRDARFQGGDIRDGKGHQSRGLRRWSSTATVAAGQTASFTGSGGELALHDPSGFAGVISGFDTAGAGSNDTIEVAGPWVFTGFTENAGGTQGTLGFANGASTLSLTLLGDYNHARLRS